MEKPLRPYVLVIACLLIPVQASAEKILITADTQYGWFGTRACAKERASFRKIVDIVNGEKFDALIILGDLADSYPRTRQSRARQVNFLLDDLKRIRHARVFLVAGNHDLGEDAPNWAVREFEIAFGTPTQYAFRIGGHKFLVLNSTLLQNYRERPLEYRAQLEFIRRNSDAKFVLVHHPPFSYSPREPGGYFRWKVKPRNDILPLLRPGTYIFSGHTHRAFQRTTSGLRNMGVGTCCAPWGNGRLTYGVLEISPAEIRYTERQLH
jgi:predicted phosphodiesterase